ncbi:hypothetical protein KY284_028149 [Solanum tuberosum]|nr:hypothetical protein KY284_028149 [Solanum tuberosum]
MLSLMPSFGRKLDPRGYSPMHLAPSNEQEDTVKLLIRYDPKLIQVRSRERITPLHYQQGPAQTDNVDLLSEFLLASPTAIKEVTIRGETAVHLAVSRNKFPAFKVLMGWLYRTGNKKILDWKDNEGSTVLHIAAETGQVEVVKILAKELVHLDIRNRYDMTALAIVEERITCSQNHSAFSVDLNQEYVNIQKILHEVGAMKTSDLPKNFKMADLLQEIPRLIDLANVIRSQAAVIVDSRKGLTEDVRNAYLVVTILLVTASFQAVLSPPGGGWERKDDDTNNNNTSLVMPANTTNSSIHRHSFPIRRDPKKGLFYPFLIMNSITFALAVALTFTLLPFHVETTALLLWSLLFLMVTYSMSVMLISPNDNGQWIIAAACSFAALFGVHGFFIFSKLTQVAGSRWIPIPCVTNFIRRTCTRDLKRYHMERKVRLSKYNST